jgi:hypothetical protein
VTAVTPREILARTLWGGEDRSGGEKGMEAGAQRLLSDTLWPSRVRVPHTRQRYDPAVFSKLRRPSSRDRKTMVQFTLRPRMP